MTRCAWCAGDGWRSVNFSELSRGERVKLLRLYGLEQAQKVNLVKKCECRKRVA